MNAHCWLPRSASPDTRTELRLLQESKNRESLLRDVSPAHREKGVIEYFVYTPESMMKLSLLAMPGV